MQKAKITRLKPLQVTTEAGEVYEGLEHFQHYGFSSGPPLETSVVLHGETLLGEANTQELKEGETLVHAGEKSKILLSPSGKVMLKFGEMELLEFLSEILKEISKLSTTTAPISPASSAKFMELDLKLQAAIYG